MPAYVDTSALVKRYVAEVGWPGASAPGPSRAVRDLYVSPVPGRSDQRVAAPGPGRVAGRGPGPAARPPCHRPLCAALSSGRPTSRWTKRVAFRPIRCARRCGPPGVCLDDPADHTGAGPATAQLCCGGYRLAHGGHRRRVRRGRSAAAPLSPARTGLCGVTQVQGVAAASIAATPPVGCPVPSTEYLGHSGNHDTLAQELPASLA